MHQINEAKSAGYDQDEIVNEVIRAMVPRQKLFQINWLHFRQRLRI